MPVNDEAVAAARAYADSYYHDDAIAKDFEPLVRYCPDVYAGYMNLRESLFREPPEGALPRKFKELAVLAIEISNRKTNPPPIGHARSAIDAGASVAEVAEIVGLCIMLGGMITYRESGRFVMQEVIRINDERGAASTN